jgi:hypothetical protein
MSPPLFDVGRFGDVVAHPILGGLHHRYARIFSEGTGGGGPPGERNGQYRHGERTKAAIAEQQKFSALLKMLRAGLT